MSVGCMFYGSQACPWYITEENRIPKLDEWRYINLKYNIGRVNKVQITGNFQYNCRKMSVSNVNISISSENRLQQQFLSRIQQNFAKMKHDKRCLEFVHIDTHFFSNNSIDSWLNQVNISHKTLYLCELLLKFSQIAQKLKITRKTIFWAIASRSL